MSAPPPGSLLLSPSARPSRRRIGAALALCAVAYLYVFPYQPALRNPNEDVRLYMSAALVEEGTYVIDGMRERWGWVNDAAVFEGHAYSVKAPGSSFLGVIPYAAYLHGSRLLGHPFDRTEALWVCRFFASVLPLLLFYAYFYRWLGRVCRSPWVRDALFFSVALGSLLYGYGLLFVSHSLSAACAFVAFVLLSDAHAAGRTKASSAFWAGMMAAGVSFFEYPGFVCSFALSLFALFALRPKRWIPFALGALLPTLLVMHFQWKCFGSPLTPGHLYVETEAFREQHHQGFYGATGLSGAALFGLLLDPGAGLFPLTPILIFAVPGLFFALREPRRRTSGWVALACVIGTTLAISAMNNWRGGWTIGPRYLATVVPFVALFAAYGLEALGRRWPRLTAALAIGATATALLGSGTLSAYYPHLPPELTRPLPQLMPTLIGHGFAPLNAAGLASIYGSLSMLPLALLGLGALIFALTAEGSGRDRALAGLGAIPMAALFLAPLVIEPPSQPERPIREAVAFVTRSWHPAGHDRAARMQAELTPDSPPEQWEALAQVYEAEGREREAAQARRRHHPAQGVRLPPRPPPRPPIKRR